MPLMSEMFYQVKTPQSEALKQLRQVNKIHMTPSFMFPIQIHRTEEHMNGWGL